MLKPLTPYMREEFLAKNPRPEREVWHVRDSSADHGKVVCDENGLSVAHFTNEADARLGAAAPAMLDALKRAEWWISTDPVGGAMRDILRAVILEAEGRTDG